MERLIWICFAAQRRREVWRSLLGRRTLQQRPIRTGRLIMNLVVFLIAVDASVRHASLSDRRLAVTISFSRFHHVFQLQLRRRRS